MLAVGFIGVGAGYMGTRRIVLSIGAFLVAGLFLAVWAAVGKCWKLRLPPQQR
jgi:hypothetical protein